MTDQKQTGVETGAAAQLLDRMVPDDYTNQWTAHFSKPAQTTQLETESALLFRLGAEWYALPSVVIEEIAPIRPVHSIPHRRAKAVDGIVNVRGELLVCVSLAVLLGVGSAAAAPSKTEAQVTRRLLVLRRDDVHAACQVDEVSGVMRFDPAALTGIPGTLARAGSRYTRQLLPWQERLVGLLDEQLVFNTIRRSLA